jgi:hypothetical protein
VGAVLHAARVRRAGRAHRLRRMAAPVRRSACTGC